MTLLRSTHLSWFLFKTVKLRNTLLSGYVRTVKVICVSQEHERIEDRFRILGGGVGWLLGFLASTNREPNWERLSNDFRKANSKVITPANQNRSKLRDEPIRISRTCCNSKHKENHAYTGGRGGFAFLTPQSAQQSQLTVIWNCSNMSISSHRKLARGKKKSEKQFTNEAQDFKSSGYYHWFLDRSQLFCSLLICFFFSFNHWGRKNWGRSVSIKFLFLGFPKQEGVHMAAYPTLPPPWNYPCEYM